MAVPYARSKDAPDTVYMHFKVIHSARATIDGDLDNDVDIGKSPVARYLTYALSFEDFVSRPAAVGWRARCLVPRGSIIDGCFVRVDVGFLANAPAIAIDIGDENDPNGWGDNMDFTGAGILQEDVSAAYMAYADPNPGVAGRQYYPDGMPIDVIWPNAVAPTQGEALVFLRTVSYHEVLGAEWA